MKYVILAGGSGTRLWPLSRQKAPKQFINLIDEHSMLQNTALRVSKEKGDDIFVLSNKDSKFIVMDQLTEIFGNYREDQIIVEPIGRNTAPAIAYGTQFFHPDDIVAVLSSDHHIAIPDEFERILEESGKIAELGKIVTIGIVPDSPKTGYGYIKRSFQPICSGFAVERFVEKPDQTTAQEYLDSGEYYWNAGIFVFRVSSFLQELKKYSPEIYEVALQLGEKVRKTGRSSVTLEDYQRFPKISIDYALMEKSDQIAVVPGSFGWSDVGSFRSLFEIFPKDENNNAVKTAKDAFKNIDSHNMLVIGNQRKIAAIHLDHLVIVDTPDALLIANREDVEKVKEVVADLEMEQAQEALIHKTVYRPWGAYTVLDEGATYKVKQLLIYPGKRISLQYHYHRSENWTVASGVAEVFINGETRILKTSESMFIPSATQHRLTNPSKVKVLKIIEVQTGEYLGEEDIIRIEDDYSR